MRKIAEIRKDYKAKVDEARNYSVGTEEWTKCSAELDALGAELKAAQDLEAHEQKAAEQALSNKEKATGKRFSLVKFIRELSQGGKLTGIEADVAKAGEDEYRRLGLSQQGVVLPSFALSRAADGQNYTEDKDGGYLIETMKARYVETLRDKLVVSKLGATVLTDLIGTLPVISSSDIEAAWGAEGDEADFSKVEFGKATMTPHRSYIAVALTKDLLRQTSYDVERMLMDKITSAHAQLLEKAAIQGSGSDNEPLGIVNTTGIGSVSGDVSWDNIVALETKINAENANRGKMAYLTNATQWGALKTAKKDAGSGLFVLDSPYTHMNGYPVDWTNVCPDAVIFGNFEDLYIGQWGGIDIVVDPYTSARKAQVNIVLNAWNDCLVAEPKSFAVLKSA